MGFYCSFLLRATLNEFIFPCRSLRTSYSPVYLDLWIIIGYNLQDGKVSIDEYIGDMYKSEDGIDEEEPDWVKQEREQFVSYRSVVSYIYSDIVHSLLGT